MAHLHPVYDSDAHYIIDPITRNMSTVSKKVFLMQNDHDSERFSFEIPKEIEGHDMSLSTSVKIHYVNTNSATRDKYSGVYEVDDLTESDNDSDTLVFTWLLSRNATKYAGSLSFSVVFECTDDNLMIVYRWSTDINNSVNIKKSLNNDNTIIELYPDILERWKQELYSKNYPYETAVKYGFTGSEQDWLLTLKGDSGIWIGGSEPNESYFWFDTDEETTSIYIDAPYDPSGGGSEGGGGSGGGSGVTPVISVSASVDSNTGTPSVTVNKSGTDAAPNFEFAFHNLKGTNGINGQDGVDGLSPTVSVTNITGGHRVIITDADGPHQFDVMDGENGGGSGDGTSVVANPTLVGTEAELTGLQVGNTKYKVPSGGGVHITTIDNVKHISFNSSDSNLEELDEVLDEYY